MLVGFDGAERDIEGGGDLRVGAGRQELKTRSSAAVSGRAAERPGRGVAGWVARTSSAASMSWSNKRIRYLRGVLDQCSRKRSTWDGPVRNPAALMRATVSR
jgi:hypothetical protein